MDDQTRVSEGRFPELFRYINQLLSSHENREALSKDYYVHFCTAYEKTAEIYEETVWLVCISQKSSPQNYKNR